MHELVALKSAPTKKRFAMTDDTVQPIDENIPDENRLIAERRGPVLDELAIGAGAKGNLQELLERVNELGIRSDEERTY